MADFPYQVLRTDEKPPMDGRLDAACWQRAQKSPVFVDMETGAPALYQSTAAVLWDDEALYVGFWNEEPHPTATLTERDSIVFRENDVEVFIDGGDCYYEFEVNALNTIYEVFFIWRDAYKRDGRFDIPEFDLIDRKAFSFAGDYDRLPESFWYGTHPRGARWAFLDWDFPGIESAVHVLGSVNDQTQRSTGWNAEVKFPWAGMKHLANGRSLPPSPGDLWRLFLGRFQVVPLGSKEARAAWCWSPHGAYDTHMPEKFTSLQMSSLTV